VRAARIRTEQLRAKYGPEAKITWLVYKQGYIDRGAQEKMDLLGFIGSVRDKFNLNLVWFRGGDEVINYLNSGQPRGQIKVAFFEFFGHSNKACFMFDYSSNVDSASKSFLHQSQLTSINRSAFTRDAQIRSWGCHTGEMMSKKWRDAVGNRMWGVIGKTQYMTDELPIISTPGGKWTN
jgi:diadenosine tetraphosphatase ApaH/serine/threonine PP2A family protein phosphatase